MFRQFINRSLGWATDVTDQYYEQTIEIELNDSFI